MQARACALGGWVELLGQAIVRTSDAAVMLFLGLVVCAALVLIAFVLWPLTAAGVLGLALRKGQVLLRKGRP